MNTGPDVGWWEAMRAVSELREALSELGEEELCRRCVELEACIEAKEEHSADFRGRRFIEQATKDAARFKADVEQAKVLRTGQVQ